MASPQDPFNLQRFHTRQRFRPSGIGLTDQEHALNQIRNGVKTSHWMWWIFPQVSTSPGSTSQNFAIKSYAEARAYYNDNALWNNLVAITNAVNNSCKDFYTTVDRLFRLQPADADAFKSCITLFALLEYVDADPQWTFFTETARYHYGRDHTAWDQATIAFLEADAAYIAARTQRPGGHHVVAAAQQQQQQTDRSQWPVRTVVDVRVNAANGTLEYRAQWNFLEVPATDGYDAWYPSYRLAVYPELLQEFHELNADRPGPPRGLQRWLGMAGQDLAITRDDMLPV